VYKIAETQVDPAEAVQVELREVFDRARRGDLNALPRLRELLDDRPELWRSYGDVAKHALASWIKLIAGDELALEESLGRKAAAMRNELVSPSSSPLEGRLADRVIASWLQLAQAEATVAQATNSTMKQLAFAEKRLDAAHRRHLNAIGALATLQRLMPSTPALPSLETTIPRGEAPTENITTEAPPGETANLAKPSDEVPEERLGEVAEAAAILAFVLPTSPRMGSPRPA
jgi:hypothetical protein